MKDNIEELKIYQEYTDLMQYIELITKKYPKSERYCLVHKIKCVSYDGMELLIDSYKEYVLKEKLRLLNQVDSKLKLMKALVRISYSNRYISIANYKAWSRKMTNICNSLGGWMIACQRQLKTHSIIS